MTFAMFTEASEALKAKSSFPSLLPDNQSGKLLGIPKAKLYLESCTVVFDDVFGRHVKVGGEIDFMSSRFGIMDHDFDVAFHRL